MRRGNSLWANQTALHELGQLLIHIADLQDPSAEKHATGVANLIPKFGARMNIDHESIITLGYAGMLHDIGKLQSANLSLANQRVLLELNI